MIRLLVAVGCVVLACASSVRVAAALRATETQDPPTIKIDDKLVPKLILKLKSGETPKTRLAAMLALESLIGLKDPAVVPALIESLNDDKSEEVRAAAAQTLGRLAVLATESVSKESPVPKIAKALKTALPKDPSPEVRQAIAKALGGKTVEYMPDVVEVLADALKDQDAGTRAAAAASLKDAGKEVLPVLPKVWDAAKNAKLDTFTRIYLLQIVTKHSGDTAQVVQVLVGVVADKEAASTLKQVAVDQLATFHRDALAATDPLVDLLKDDQSPALLRQSAAMALAKIQPDSKKVWPTSKKLMQPKHNSNAALRAQVIRLAAKVCKTESELIPALMEACADPNVDAQIAAIQELGEMGSAARAAEKTIAEIAMTASRDNVRQAATLALKKIQGG